MTYTEACKLLIIPRGEWNAETEYRRLDLVIYNNNYYVALTSSLNQIPFDGSEYWDIIVNDHEVAGRILSIPKGEWNSAIEYKYLDTVTHNDMLYMALKDSINQEPVSRTNTEYWMFLVEPYLVDVIGASAEEDGVNGLAIEPKAGEEDNVLLGNGTWGRKLQTSIVSEAVENNEPSETSDDEKESFIYGYMNAENEMIPFITYEEAIANSLVGNAQPSDVVAGKTFSNATERGLSGTMRDYSQDTQLVVTTDQYDANRPIIQQTKVNNVGYYEVSVPTGYWRRSLGNSSILIPCEEKSISINGATATVTPSAGKVLSKVTCVSAAAPTQTKTVTAGTSNLTVKPDSGKLLSQVTVQPTPTQSKTVTASRSAQTVKPDSGKHLSQVVINKFPDATGTFKCGSNNGASANNDMGTSNNYRYVDATNVYKLGKSEALGKLTDVARKYAFQVEGNYKWGQYTGVPVGYYIIRYITSEYEAYSHGERFNLPTNSSAVTVFYDGWFETYKSYRESGYCYIAIIKTTNTTLRWDTASDYKNRYVIDNIHATYKGWQDNLFKMYAVT